MSNIRPGAAPKCWKDEIVDKYFTTEATEKKKKEIFEQLHLPINNIKVLYTNEPLSSDIISEEELRDLIIKSDPSPDVFNRVFLLTGESGCGKSELCQWLVYNINDGIHVPIHIAREVVRPTHIIEILNQYCEIKQDDMIDIIDLHPIVFASKLLGEVMMDIQYANKKLGIDFQPLVVALNKTAFKDMLIENFIKYQEEIKKIEDQKAYADEKKLSLLSLDDLRQKASGVKKIDLAFDIIQRGITNCLEHELKLGSIDEKLRQISEKFLRSGKRPVLIIEDITSTGFLRNGILSYLLSKASGHFDAIIGVTTGFARDHHQEIFGSSKDTDYARLEGRFTMTDDNLETLFLQNNYVALAEKYLSSIKENCYNCPHKNVCAEAFDGLYPFNRPFLDKIYSNLGERDDRGNFHPKRTPRLFIKDVMAAVLKANYKFVTPPEAVEGRVINPGETFARDPSWPQDFSLVLKWYGKFDETKGITSAPAKIFSLLNINIPPGINVINDQVIVGGMKASNALKEFQTWLENGGKYPTRNVLEKGVLTALSLFGVNSLEIKHPNSAITDYLSIQYQLSKKTLPIWIQDTTDREELVQIRVTRDDKDKTVLQQLWVLGDAGHAGDVLSGPNINFIDIEEWARRKHSEALAEMEDKLHKILGIPYSHFVLLGWFICKNLVDGVKDIKKSEIRNPLKGKGLNPLLEKIDKVGQIKKLADKGNIFEGLFRGLFYIRGSIFDVKRFLDEVEGFDLQNAIKSIKSTVTGSELSRFRISKGHDFSEVVIALLGFLNLDVFRENFKPLIYEITSQFSEVVESAGQDNMQDLYQKTKELIKAYKSVQLHLKLPWDPEWESTISDINAEKLDSTYLLSAKEKILERVPSEGKATIFDYSYFSQIASAALRRPEYKLANLACQLIENLSEALEQSTKNKDLRDTKELNDYKEKLKEIDSLTNFLP